MSGLVGQDLVEHGDHARQVGEVQRPHRLEPGADGVGAFEVFKGFFLLVAGSDALGLHVLGGAAEGHAEQGVGYSKLKVKVLNENLHL